MSTSRIAVLVLIVLGSACVRALDPGDSTPVGCLQDGHCPDGLVCLGRFALAGTCGCDLSADCDPECACDDECRVCVPFSLCPDGCDDDNECTAEYCEPGRGCVHEPVPGSCQDACIREGICVGGVCTEGTRVECPPATSPCVESVCDPIQGECVMRPRVGIPCDDGLFCTISDSCREDGVCAGGRPRDCTASNTQCIRSTCDESSDRCVSASTPGVSCDDGLFCTVGEKCRNDGTCGGGSVNGCSGTTEFGECQRVTCDESSDECVVVPANVGSSCGNSFCVTGGTVCRADGTCGSGAARDCSSAVTTPACQVGRCDEATRSCYADPIQGTCEDGLFCTVGESCQDGSCWGGVARDCSQVLTNPACQRARCDEATRRCLAEPLVGVACDDGMFCTTGETCQLDGFCRGGAFDRCAGTPVPQPQCQQASCDEALDQCSVGAANVGLSCNDGIVGTVGEVCQSDGACRPADGCADGSVELGFDGWGRQDIVLCELPTPAPNPPRVTEGAVLQCAVGWHVCTGSEFTARNDGLPRALLSFAATVDDGANCFAMNIVSNSQFSAELDTVRASFPGTCTGPGSSTAWGRQQYPACEGSCGVLCCR
ncbi:MAG: hypothetical protein HY791_32170 [Deltaproteobacteria bacterium]|nr:hypothetical protein [Deltaproteobacteria bacterium]